MLDFKGDPQHLKIVKRGSDYLNTTRADNPFERLNLRGADLTNAKLRGANLTGVDLTGADLSMADLSGVFFMGAYLSRTNFRGADLHYADFRDSDLRDADLSSANLTNARLFPDDSRGANLSSVDLHNTILRNTNLPDTDLTSANLGGVVLRGATLVRSIFRGADLRDADLRDANLRDADFRNANLHNSDLRHADLRYADLSHADLSNADLSNAILINANLSSANLSRAILRETILTGANLNDFDVKEAILDGTVFSKTNLAKVKNLRTCKPSNPSTIDFQTLEASQPLPIEFLRACGLSDDFINYLPNFFEQPRQYYSLFISYSTKDEEFVQKLFADLQNAGIHCWYAPKDLKAGQKQYEQISNAIHLNDRLLLILSHNSIESDWVKIEISKARKRENKENRNILFPITLMPIEDLADWELFDIDLKSDSAKEVREFFIPSFENWQDQATYDQGFLKLVRDLKRPRNPKTQLK